MPKEQLWIGSGEGQSTLKRRIKRRQLPANEPLFSSPVLIVKVSGCKEKLQIEFIKQKLQKSNQKMSTCYYNRQWQQAICGLLEAVEEQNAPLQQGPAQKSLTQTKSDYEWFQYYAALYLRYIDIYRKLQDAYDQMIHPQKRILMRQMLNNVLVRMCEVKQNIVRYSTHTPIIQSDFINIDEVLLEMKLTPKALQVPLPRFVNDEKTPRDQTIQKLVRQLQISQEKEQLHDRVALDTNFQTAIRIIQKLERGRQGINRGVEFAKLRSKALKQKKAELSNEQDSRAKVVQKYWRAFLSRRQLAKVRQEQAVFLGIEKEKSSSSLIQEAELQRQKLKVLQKQKQDKFIQDKQLIRKDMKRIQQPTLQANMLEQRRKWIQKFLEMQEFSSLPQKAQDFYKNQDFSKQQLAEKKNPGKNQKNKEKGNQVKGKNKKNEVDKFLDDHFSLGPTEEVMKLQQKIQEYNQKWGQEDLESEPSEAYNVEMAKDQIRPQIQTELQRIVDGLINLQLDNMRIKYGIKKKKEKKIKKKKKKQKKVKVPQGLAKRDPQDLLEDLFEKNIAKLLHNAKFQDFRGEHNPIANLLEKTAQEMPDPALSQVRNLVAEYVGIPLGSKYAKEKLQKWSWFLFYGASGTGKTLLLRALHRETKALVFDLTPQIVREKFSQKAELTRLIWSVILCAKYFQPVIIMIDDFETIFPATKGKKGSTNASFGLKMKKVITDMKKNKYWSKNDQIVVIACSNKPYQSSVKDVKKLFDKKIYFPFPNYASRKLLIEQFLQQKCQQAAKDFSFQTFAQVTQGFTAGSFKNAIDKVLTPLRISRLREEPLRLNELIRPLANSSCVFYEQYGKLRKFTDQIQGFKEKREARLQLNRPENKKVPDKKRGR